MNLKSSLLHKIKLGSWATLLAIAIAAPVTFSSPIPLSVSPFCACCVDMGRWDFETRKIYDHERETLNTLKLDGVAQFYMTAGWPDDVSGVSPPVEDLAEELVVSIVREQNNWKLFFKTKTGRTGALILTMPGTATFFNADIGEGPRPERKGTIGVYKEIRLEGQVRGTGMFAKGIAAKTKCRLVLQGSGNGCLNAEDFHRWNLRVSGPKAGYTIYGYFAKPSPETNPK